MLGVETKNVERLAGVVKVVGSKAGLERCTEVKARDRSERLTELGLKVTGTVRRGDGVCRLRGGHVGHDSVDRLERGNDADGVIIAIHVLGRIPGILGLVGVRIQCGSEHLYATEVGRR